MGKRRNDFDRNEVVRTVDSTPSRFVLCFQPAGTDDRQKRLAHRHLIFQACFKVDPNEIHEEIFVPKCLRYPVVQPTGSLGRTFSTVIDENLTEHRPQTAPENKFYRRTGQINRGPALSFTTKAGQTWRSTAKLLTRDEARGGLRPKWRRCRSFCSAMVRERSVSGGIMAELPPKP